MKKSVMLVMIIGVAFSTTSCFKKVKKAQEDFKEAKEGIGLYSKAAKEIKNMTDDIEDLANLEPLTNEDFKSWMPEKIGNLKRTGFKNNTLAGMNVASSEATYKDESGEQEFKVTVIDGAGTGSFAIAGIRMVVSMDMEEESEGGYKKTVTKDGVKALEEYKNYNDRTNLSFMHDERFGITVNTRNMKPEETWKHVDDLQLSKLTKLAK